MSNRHITILALALAAVTYGCVQKSESTSEKSTPQVSSTKKQATNAAPTNISYSNKLTALANGDTLGFWPIKNNPASLKGAILPYKRIVAYYGNIYSKRMGILGEYPPKELWRRLNIEVKAWEEADTTTPVQPAIHYIAVVAQGIPKNDGKYRMRMPRRQIDSALAIAKMGNAIVFLDIQVGHSSVQEEVPQLEKYLKMPHVHLGIDPEFSMKTGSIPGHKIGTMDADDINYCSDYLAKLVKANNLPPKILVVHRFTQGMVKRYRDIKLCPEVQIVMNMDGWGEPVLKKNTYKQYVYKEPVQFAGFKLFYKNDLKKEPHRMLTPPELMKLKPKPIYIMYQ